MANILKGDCLERLAELPADSVDSIVTDPPYGLSFMGNKWDHNVPSVDIWRECLRVLKPGGHLLAFAGTRTQHRMVVNIEDAGFEIRDMIAWVYGSGFPKSLDVSKAIDKAAGAEREFVGFDPIAAAKANKRPAGEMNARYRNSEAANDNGATITAPATDAARQWEGWGTALKPAIEPITVARKPFKGTVAANVMEYGTGAINVDGCRVDAEKPTGWGGDGSNLYEGGLSRDGGEPRPTQGRFPANLIHDGSDEVVGLFPVTEAAKASMRGDRTGVNTGFGGGDSMHGHNDNGGSAARFFYCAKASKRDRDGGCERLPEVLTARYGETGQGPLPQQTPKKPVPQRNPHPTVKPTKLMRYLVRLVTPPGGTVLDPFMGSGSTGKAAALEGSPFIGIEISPEYIEIARARIEHAEAEAGEER